jgi:hypothetical protein
MAILPALQLGTFFGGATTNIVGTEPVLQLIASANDSSYLRTNNNSTHIAWAGFSLADMPTDFQSMDSVSIRLRYYQSGMSNNTWNTLRARIVDSASVAFSEWATVATNITNTSGLNSAVIPITLTASYNQAVWNGARVEIEFSITRNKGGDTYEARVSAAEVTGTYTQAIINYERSFTETITNTEERRLTSGKALSDTETATDIRTFTFGKSLSDSSTILDEVRRLSGKTLNDSAITSDEISTVLFTAFTESLSDTSNTSDTISLSLSRRAGAFFKFMIG